MNQKKIYITKPDQARIRQLVLFCDIFNEREQKAIRKLDHDVSRGRVVGEHEMPRDTVGIDSRVTLKEITGGLKLTLTLVFPEEEDTRENRISILTPMGMSLIGAKTGDIVEYREPSVVYKFVVQNTYRPPSHA